MTSSVSIGKILLNYISLIVLATHVGGCGGGGGGSAQKQVGSTSSKVSQSSSLPSSISSSSVSSHQPSSSSVPSTQVGFPVEQVNSPKSLSRAMNFPGGYQVTGATLVPEQANGGRISVTPEIAITAGGTTYFEVTANLPSGYYVHAYVVQLEGTDTSFIIPVDKEGHPITNLIHNVQDSIDHRNSGTLLSLNAYPNIDLVSADGTAVSRYEVPAMISAYVQRGLPSDEPTTFLSPGMSRNPEHWTTPETVMIALGAVQKGDLQVTLTWDTAADVDLYLHEPDGNIISFYNERSLAGDGFLDVDDVDGYGPENIFYAAIIPQGQYLLEVHAFDGYEEDFPINYTVTLKRGSKIDTFSGTLRKYDDQVAVTFFNIGDEQDTVILTGPGSTVPGTYRVHANILLDDNSCAGYSEENFQEFYESHEARDKELHFLCLSAFTHYANYKESIRMGYSEAEASDLYDLFLNAALLANTHYANSGTLPTKYTLRTSSIGQGQGSVSPRAGSYVPGSILSIQPRPHFYSYFDSWSDISSHCPGINLGCRFAIERDVHMQAKFSPRVWTTVINNFTYATRNEATGCSWNVNWRKIVIDVQYRLQADGRYVGHLEFNGDFRASGASSSCTSTEDSVRRSIQFPATGSRLDVRFAATETSLAAQYFTVYVDSLNNRGMSLGGIAVEYVGANRSGSSSLPFIIFTTRIF